MEYLFLGLNFDLRQILSSFMVLFAIIDITGSIPVIISLKQKAKVQSGKVALISFLILLSFLFVGDALLGLFGVDISSFAVAGAIIILILAAEMLLDVEIFKSNSDNGGSVTVVPLIFPLIAGTGTMTTLLSLRAEFDVENIIVALALNMTVVFFVLKYVHIAEKIIGDKGIFVLRKFFGIILLAMAVKLFTTNLVSVVSLAS